MWPGHQWHYALKSIRENRNKWPQIESFQVETKCIWLKRALKCRLNCTANNMYNKNTKNRPSHRKLQRSTTERGLNFADIRLTGFSVGKHFHMRTVRSALELKTVVPLGDMAILLIRPLCPVSSPNLCRLGYFQSCSLWLSCEVRSSEYSVFQTIPDTALFVSNVLTHSPLLAFQNFTVQSAPPVASTFFFHGHQDRPLTAPLCWLRA